MLRFKYSNILHKMQIKTEKNFYYCVIEYIFAMFYNLNALLKTNF